MTNDNERPPLLFQCKHTQQNQLANEAGIRDVLRARARYELPREPELVAITNAHGFTPSACRLADDECVCLVHRELLGLLARWRAE